MTMIIQGQADSAFTLLNLLADPQKAQKQLQDLVEATKIHDEALTKLLNERKNQRSLEDIKSDYQAKATIADQTIADYNKLSSDLKTKTDLLSSKQEELNQRVTQFNKYLEDTKASMNARENTIKELEVVIQKNLEKSQSDNAIASALRKSLEDKHTKVKAIINS